MGQSPRYYVSSFVEIGPLVQEKIFEGFFFTINGRGGHLGHVTDMPQTNFRSPYPWRLHIKAVSEDKIFENGLRRTDGPRSMGIL